MEEIVDYYQYRKLSYIDESKKLKGFEVSDKDKKILRELAKIKSGIAGLHVQDEKIKLWKDLNSLKDTRPLIWINEIPWHEMDYNGELKLQTSSEFAQFLETRLKRTIYRWNHLKADMVVENTLPCYIYFNGLEFGISEEVRIAKTDEVSDIFSREFTPQFKDEDDIEKIKYPQISIDELKTKEMFQSMKDIFDKILLVEKKGVPGFIFNPWDKLIRWYGVQQALTDLIKKPQYIHKIMNRLTNSYLSGLKQFEDLNLLTLNNGNYRIGSGGLGYSDELPQKDFDQEHIRPLDMWGNGMAQIFSDVSPDMHYEFALKYEIEWMEKFGLNYYGCCEPLDKKMEILKKIPRLRKISMSAWVNLENAVSEIGKDFVFSYKPSPAIFATESWDLESVKENIIDYTKKTKNCVLEIIMKDISTVKYKPQRLWEWSKVAMEVAESF